ncbi:MAG TPA: prepilin-type N-terminal cleavage/methylation domain-containing protein [Candidatus Saccharimonadales bacterium]
MSRVNTYKGFTLVELMLAMTFISILLVGIAITTIQISRIYNKGITLREVNQSGRAVADELQRTIASSTPFDADPASPTSRYIVRPGGGRLCVGRYSYTWNYGSAIAGGSGAPAVFTRYQDNNDPVRFAKVDDPSASLCQDPNLRVNRGLATEMLSAGDRDLVVHAFTVTRGSSDLDIGQALYAISMTIGTNDQQQLVTNDSACKPPAQGVGNEDYCAVNQFDIVARAGNKSEGE